MGKHWGKQWGKCDGRAVGRWNSVKEHFGEGCWELTGLYTYGLQGAGYPNEGNGGRKGIAEPLVVGQVVWVELEAFIETEGSCEST